MWIPVPKAGAFASELTEKVKYGSLYLICESPSLILQNFEAYDSRRGNDQKPLHEPVMVAPCTRKSEYVEGHCSWPFLRVQEQCAQRFEEQSAHLLHMRIPQSRWHAQ
jgi:hypothetical protein